MATSSTDAANAAVDRLREVRARAGQRRAASKAAVEQLRERNREETRQLSERAKLARRGQGQQQWPDANRPPREMHLYDTEDEAPRPAQPPVSAPPPPVAHPRPAAGAPAPQRRPTDDDWSQESWLH